MYLYWANKIDQYKNKFQKAISYAQQTNSNGVELPLPYKYPYFIPNMLKKY